MIAAEFVHGAAPCTLDHLCLGRAPCIHAGAGRQGPDPADLHALEYPPDIVTALERLLPRLGGQHRIAIMKDGDCGLAVVLGDHAGQSGAAMDARGWCRMKGIFIAMTLGRDRKAGQRFLRMTRATMVPDRKPTPATVMMAAPKPKRSAISPVDRAPKA